MNERNVSEKTRKGREHLKEVREKKREEKQRRREELDRMLGGSFQPGKPRRSKKRATFQPGHHGNK